MSQEGVSKLEKAPVSHKDTDDDMSEIFGYLLQNDKEELTVSDKKWDLDHI